MTKPKMDSKELGLVLGQQLLDVDDLHYGLWEDDIELSFGNIPLAQERYTERLFEAFPPASEVTRVLDIGCGTGNTMTKLLERGYKVDGVSPSASLANIVRERLERQPGHDSMVFECKLEEFPVNDYRGAYDLILFSESFQYIRMDESFPVLEQLIAPGGRIIICDFFKTEHHEDGRAGDHSLSGGHHWHKFENEVAKRPFEVELDRDITRLVSPNFTLLNDLLMNKTKPLLETYSLYLESNYRRTWKLLRWLFRKRWKKLNYKYFSGHRSPEVFERYKSYRLLVLHHTG